jgi:hypothetical protein
VRLDLQLSFEETMERIRKAKRTAFFAYVATVLPRKVPLGTAPSGSAQDRTIATTCVQLTRTEALSFVESTVGATGRRLGYRIDVSIDGYEHGSKSLMFLGTNVGVR